MNTHSKGLTDENLQVLDLKRGSYGSFRKVPEWTSAASGLCPGNAAERPGATGLVCRRGFLVSPWQPQSINRLSLPARAFRAGRGRGEWGQVVFGKAVR
jgi:hypothetical protein